MKFLFFIVITWFSYCSFSQINIVTLEGIVTTDDVKDPVENAIIRLKLSSGVMLEEKTDALGKYKFTVKDTTSNFSITIATDKSTRSLSRSSSCFFASRDEGKGTLKANTNFIKDFQLTKVLDCGGRMPYILFTTNSIISCNDSLHKINPNTYDSFIDAINMFYETIEANPTIVIEIAGHASSWEKNPEELSLKRAEDIREKLVLKGINRDRILIKSWGNRKLLVTDQMINEAKNAKTKEEKASIHLKNQRVVFRIVSWDFKE